MEAPLKLQIVSDLHCELYGFDRIEVAAPILALLGDIMCLDDTENVEKFLTDVCARWKLVLYIPGNHEYFNDRGRTIDDLDSKMRRYETRFVNFRYLNFDSVRIGSYRIVCGTMWSLISPENRDLVNRLCRDYSKIPALKVDDTNEMHFMFREYLEYELKEAKRRDEKVVVLTHHAPLIEGTANPRYLMRTNRGVNEAFATDMSAYMQNGDILLWAFGHTHYCCDFRFGTTRIYSNPKGHPHDYKQRNFDFRYDRVVETI